MLFIVSLRSHYIYLLSINNSRKYLFHIKKLYIWIMWISVLLCHIILSKNHLYIKTNWFLNKSNIRDIIFPCLWYITICFHMESIFQSLCVENYISLNIFMDWNFAIYIFFLKENRINILIYRDIFSVNFHLFIWSIWCLRSK